MKNLIFIVILSFCGTFLFSQTTIPAGYVSGTWDLAGSPYLIEGEITIPDGHTLTIDPGCLIEFQGHYKLKVQGRILAIGTEQDSIRFTIADTTGFSNTAVTNGGWHGIRFDETPAINDSSKIIYCFIDYGKAIHVSNVWERYGGAILVNNYSKILISNTRISNNYAQNCGGGIYLKDSNPKCNYLIINNNEPDGIVGWDSETEIKHCIVYNNSLGGISFFPKVSNSIVFNHETGIAQCNEVENCIVYANGVAIGSFIRNCSIINSLIYNNDYGFILFNEDSFIECIINNSTFTENNYGLIYSAQGWFADTEFELNNSIIYNNSDNLNISSNGSMEFTANYCLLQEIPQNINTNLYEIMNTDPFFVDPLNSNFHFGPYSPCINSGTPNTTGLNLPIYDLDGNPRIFQGVNPRIDLGPYELQSDPTGPVITVNNNPLNFGNWSPISGFSPSQQFQITNIGNEEINISLIQAPDGFLIKESGTGTYTNNIQNLIVNPNTSLSLDVVFSPSIIGNYNDYIHIYSNSVNSQDFIIEVTGFSDEYFHVVNDITIDTIWDYDLIYIHNDIVLEQGINLTITPGTTIKFNECEFDIYGNLIALGEANNEIIFTGDLIWHGLDILNPIEAPIFCYCIIKKVRHNTALYIVDSPVVTFENCVFYNNTNTCSPATLYLNNTDAVITNSEFDNNISWGDDDPVYPQGGEEAAIKAYYGNIVIQNSKFYNNVSGWGDGFQSIIRFSSSGDSLQLYNCLFYDNIAECLLSCGDNGNIMNCSSGTNQGMICCGDHLIIQNSILWNSPNAFIRSYLGIIDISYSDILGGENAIYPNTNYNWLEGNIDLDPLFIDPENGDFHFFSNSPCINAGTPDTTGLNLPEYDLDGNPRIYEDIIDMGCYEWQGTGAENDQLQITNYKLQNYPNPFNPETEISFLIPNNFKKANIEIYNIKGQKIKQYSIFNCLGWNR